MIPRLMSSRAVRSLLRGLAVALMFATGLVILTMSLVTSPVNIDPATDEVTDVGAVRATLGLLVLMTLPWYRKAPVVLLVAGTLSSVILPTEPFVLAIGLTVWIARCSRRWQWVVAGIGVGLTIVNGILHLLALSRWPGPDYRQMGQILVIAGLVVCLSLVIGIALWSRQKRKANHAEFRARSAHEDSEQLSTELVRQREREDLAREVHDTLASRLSVLSLQSGSLEETAQRSGDTELNDALRTTRGYADQALTDLRTLLTSLREGGGATSPTPSGLPGGSNDIQDLLEDATAAGLEVHPYILLDSYSSAPDAIRRAVVRVTQEALTNALRHSSDRTVDVQIVGGSGRGILLEFTNWHHPNQTFTTGAGTGLVGIRERVELVGGVVAEQRTEEQFTLTVRLPWAAD